LFKKGDLVAYATKDWHGMQYIFAEVTHDQVGSSHVHLKTVPNDVALTIEPHALTKVKTVWQDTMKLVSSKKEVYIYDTRESKPRWYAFVEFSGHDVNYLGQDGNLYENMGDNGGTYFKSKGALIDYFLNIGIDLIELRKP
jgi:hypothetical protein